MKTAIAAFAVLLLGSGAAQAADDLMTVIHRHVDDFKKSNLENILVDYAPDAVIMTPSGLMSKTGIFVGAANIRQMFGILTDPEHQPSARSLQVVYEPISADTVMMHWTHFGGTPKENHGHDVFVVRNGKIIFQGVFPDSAK